MVLAIIKANTFEALAVEARKAKQLMKEEMWESSIVPVLFELINTMASLTPLLYYKLIFELFSRFQDLITSRTST